MPSLPLAVEAFCKMENKTMKYRLLQRSRGIKADNTIPSAIVMMIAPPSEKKITSSRLIICDYLPSKTDISGFRAARGRPPA